VAGWAKEVLRNVARLLGRGDTPRTPDAAPRNFSPSDLGRSIGYAPRAPEHFRQALLHRSSLQKTGEPADSNERLEFLGDSILNLIVAEHLFRTFPAAAEGDLTKRRARLVNRKALAAYARAIDLGSFISMSASAAQATGRGSDTILADTFEAVIAAVYLDGGFGPARTFVETQILRALGEGTVVLEDENYKSQLLEYAQANGLGVPRYSIVREEGPDHDRTFTVDVAVGPVIRGRGAGKNKKDAEQEAAAAALDQIP
jgi:ribonuclease-3